MSADRTPAPVAVPEGWVEVDRADIRAGDAVRWEATDDAGRGRIDAVEYVAGFDEHGQFHAGRHLVQAPRPEPVVDGPGFGDYWTPDETPEPVVAPLPTEAVEAAARALDEAFAGYGVHDVGVTATERLARTVVAAALPHLRLVPEDDEGTVLRQWADWIEGGEAAAGLPEPFTLRTVIDAMRSGRRPFGVMAGPADGPR